MPPLPAACSLQPALQPSGSGLPGSLQPVTRRGLLPAGALSTHSWIPSPEPARRLSLPSPVTFTI